MTRRFYGRVPKVRLERSYDFIRHFVVNEYGVIHQKLRDLTKRRKLFFFSSLFKTHKSFTPFIFTMVSSHSSVCYIENKQIYSVRNSS